MDHPSILKVYEFYEDARNFYIVTEMCLGGELFAKIDEEGQLSEHASAEVMS